MTRRAKHARPYRASGRRQCGEHRRRHLEVPRAQVPNRGESQERGAVLPVQGQRGEVAGQSRHLRVRSSKNIISLLLKFIPLAIADGAGYCSPSERLGAR